MGAGFALVYVVISILWFSVGIVGSITSRAFTGDFFYANMYLWPTAVASWLVILALWASENEHSTLSEAVSKIIGFTASTAAVIVFFMQFGFMYGRLNVLLDTVDETYLSQTAYTDGFTERFIPYPVAQTRLPTVQGDTQGSTLENIVFISDPLNGNRWTGIADANSWSTTTQGVVVKWDNGLEQTCTIKINSVRHGHWWNSLVNRIRTKGVTYWIDEEDAYGDCVNGQAVIIVPLQKTHGLMLVRYPAGIAVFDSYGDMRIYTDRFPDDIHGPVYPMSLAKAQRESLTTGGGFWKWVFGSYGYDAPDDAESPNAGNESEFNLVSVGDARMYYVSPLTPAGTSQSLVGLAVVTSHTFTPGTYNTVTFARYDQPRDGLRTLSDNLRSNHEEIDWASGMRVFEIVPGLGDTYSGYVGQGTVVKYYFTFSTDGTDMYTTQPGGYNEEPESSEDGISVPSTESPGNTMTCIALWNQLEEASDQEDLSLILLITSQLVEEGCR